MRLVLDSRSASFGALIDDASLLGPSPSTMGVAVSTYRQARGSSNGWMSGRFLCPTSRLAELAGTLMRSSQVGERPWEVTAIFDGDMGASASAAQAFTAEMQPAATIASAQARVRCPDLEGIGALIDTIASIQPDIVPFLELDRGSGLGEQTQMVASEISRRFRVGGVLVGLGPDSENPSLPPMDVASFILGATTHRLPFKISTGLDRPIRCEDSDAPHHGFVNVLVAAAAAGQGAALDTVGAIIAETDPQAFSMGAAFVSWRGVSIPGPTMRRVRAKGLVSFESHDFRSTADALEDLGFIGEGT